PTTATDPSGLYYAIIITPGIGPGWGWIILPPPFVPVPVPVVDPFPPVNDPFDPYEITCSADFFGHHGSVNLFPPTQAPTQPYFKFRLSGDGAQLNVTLGRPFDPEPTLMEQLCNPGLPSPVADPGDDRDRMIDWLKDFLKKQGREAYDDSRR
ncbi:MAG: hypothetical protein KF847_14210, partial [Pirellulales bacterium]|nr:hypothetical protein [Pirellulales bacterium]